MVNCHPSKLVKTVQFCLYARVNKKKNKKELKVLFKTDVKKKRKASREMQKEDLRNPLDSKNMESIKK